MFRWGVFMIHFEGTETFGADLSAVFEYVSNAGWLAQSLPNSEITHIATDRASWKVQPKFAFMAGTLDTTATVIDRVVPESIHYRIVSQGVGSSSTMDARLRFQPTDSGGTTVKWTGDLIDLGGLLKMVPRVMLQAAAMKTIADVWQAVHQKIEGK